MNREKHARGFLSMLRAYFHARGRHIPKNFRGYSGARGYTYELPNDDLAFTVKPKQKGCRTVPLGVAMSLRKIWKKNEEPF